MSNPIAEAITQVLEEHLELMNTTGSKPEQMQRWFEQQTEPVFLNLLMKYFGGNQSAVAQALGINRATLRTRLQRHHLI